MLPLDYSSKWTQNSTLHDIKSMHYTIFQHYVDNSDSVIVNFGMHASEITISSFAHLTRYVVDVLRDSMKRDKNKRHLFRGTYPSHFRDHYGMYSESNSNLLKDSCVEWIHHRPYLDSISEALVHEVWFLSYPYSVTFLSFFSFAPPPLPHFLSLKTS